MVLVLFNKSFHNFCFFFTKTAGSRSINNKVEAVNNSFFSFSFSQFHFFFSHLSSSNKSSYLMRWLRFSGAEGLDAEQRGKGGGVLWAGKGTLALFLYKGMGSNPRKLDIYKSESNSVNTIGFSPFAFSQKHYDCYFRNLKTKIGINFGGFQPNATRRDATRRNATQTLRWCWQIKIHFRQKHFKNRFEKEPNKHFKTPKKPDFVLNICSNKLVKHQFNTLGKSYSYTPSSFLPRLAIVLVRRLVDILPLLWWSVARYLGF